MEREWCENVLVSTHGGVWSEAWLVRMAEGHRTDVVEVKCLLSMC